MTPKIRLLAFLIFSALLLSSGCSSSKPAPADVTDNARALSLIDEKKYDDAIVLLSQRLRAVPDDVEARILYASALSARNGIVLSRFVRLVTQLTQKSQSRPAADADAFEKIEWQVKLARQAFAGLPDVSTNNVGDIYSALQALQIESATPGLYVFRAILRLVIFKYEITHPYKLAINENCRVNLLPLQIWLNQIATTLQTLFQDLASGLQDTRKKDDLTQAQKKIEKVQAEINEAFTLLDLNDDIKIPKAIRKFYGVCE